MNVIERSPISGESGTAKIDDRLRGVWQHGLSWDQDVRAQQVLIEHFSSLFDGTYSAISNVGVPKYSFPVPLVLVGPSGVRVFYISAAEGIYKYRQEKWYRLDDKSGHYKISRPNIVRRAVLLTRAVFDYLEDNGLFVYRTVPMIFFSQAGIRVGVEDAPVRVLFVDGVDRFIMKMLEEKPSLEDGEIQRIVELLSTSQPAEPVKEDKIRSLLPKQEEVGVGEFRFKPWQWIVLFFLSTFLLISFIITVYLVRNLG